MAVQEMFWGARYGKLVDPYGHEWGINQQVRQLTEAEEADGAQQYFSKT
jgi:PhnB protein